MLSGGKKFVMAALVLGGCGRELTPSDTDSTLSGLDGEGLPIVAALPKTSGSCTFTNPPYRSIETASWDAGTRTFTMSGQYWKVDERADPWSRGRRAGSGASS